MKSALATFHRLRVAVVAIAAPVSPKRSMIFAAHAIILRAHRLAPPNVTTPRRPRAELDIIARHADTALGSFRVETSILAKLFTIILCSRVDVETPAVRL
jgi:hypothetical protein